MPLPAPPARAAAHVASSRLTRRSLGAHHLARQLDQKKLSLKDLQQKDSKAMRDGKRGQVGLEDKSVAMVDLPEITSLNVPVSAAKFQVVHSLAEQLRNMQGLDMKSTWVKADKAGLRVSPLQGFSAAEYVASASALVQHHPVYARALPPYLIKVCALLDKQSGYMRLRDQSGSSRALPRARCPRRRR